MKIMQKAAIYVTGGTLLLAASACEADPLHRAVKELREESIELVKKDISAEEYCKLLEGEKKIRDQFIWAGPADRATLSYWDSIKTDVLCKKAYLEGAQMVRDSIANAQKIEVNNR